MFGSKRHGVLEAIVFFSYRRKWIVLALWLVVVAAAAPFALQVDRYLKPGGFTDDSFPSIQALEVFSDKFGVASSELQVIFTHPDLTAYEPRFINGVENALSTLSERDEVIYTVSHLENLNQVSTDRHTVYATVGLDLSLEDSVDFTREAIPALDASPLEVIITGAPPLYRDLSVASSNDLQRGERLAFPLAAIALLIVFGTVVAAFTPLAVGGAGTILGLCAVFLISRNVDVSVFALNITTLLGVALGIDYSLFYTSRFREELATGKTVPEALLVSHSKAALAIIFSALTSLFGLLSLFVFSPNALQSIALGAVLVIITALASTLTLLPAVLGILGHRINRFSFRVRWNGLPSFWVPLSRWVMARPIAVLLPVIGILVILAIPITHIRLGTVDATILPSSFESRRGLDILREEFGFATTSQLAIAYTFEGDPFEPENIRNLYAYGATLESLENVSNVLSFVNLDPSLSADDYIQLYTIPEAVVDGEAARLVRETLRQGVAVFIVESLLHPFSPDARDLTREVRSLEPDNGETHITGGPAGSLDINDALYSRFPWVIAAVLVVTYISLMVMFRSLLIPLKAIVLNMMSILASYGVLVFIFQDGNFSGILGFESMGILEITTPIVLFAILFGLSMDYEIFLLARVSEAYKRTGNNTNAVAEGLQKSGIIITGSAAILIIVAASFAFADVLIVQVIGVGLAVAIFIDVTLVRALAAPAIMRLAGKWNWYIPNWLDRILPKVGYIG